MPQHRHRGQSAVGKITLNSTNLLFITLFQIQELLSGLYYQVYVEFASPMLVPWEMITSNLFRTKLDQFMRASSIFRQFSWVLV